MWGELRVTIADKHVRRTIPTRVGRTESLRRNQPSAPDHPHACGENSFASSSASCSFGPSPRVWGEHDGYLPLVDSLRTIPTRVGRTCGIRFWLAFTSDHPHACGENANRNVNRLCYCGPSPRVWGEPRLHLLKFYFRRTIPTRVGRTCATHAPHLPASDHPHACGENHRLVAEEILRYGPSPRVWGERKAFLYYWFLPRTIPTRVGRTSPSLPILSKSSDHPHACGENSFAKTQRASATGPSPRVWGERNSRRHGLGQHRTIPTRVGRTPALRLLVCCGADHPHACGENSR